jgi:hypothetical protein
LNQLGFFAQLPPQHREKGRAVKVIVLSMVAALGLAVLASYLLSTQQRPAYQAYVGSGASVGDPGENLVGRNWNGLNAGDNVAHGPHAGKG